APCWLTMACNSFAQRSLREKSCREPQCLANQIGNPLPDHDRGGVGVAGNPGRHDRGVGNAPPGGPVNAQFGVDNGHGVADRKFKAADRKFKALFAPPRPPARPAARRSAAPRDWGWTDGAEGGRIAPQGCPGVTAAGRVARRGRNNAVALKEYLEDQCRSKR